MITKNYIKMCEKADEIQKLRQYKRGDWFYTHVHRTDVTEGFHIICDDWDLCYANSNREDNWLTRAKGVWLPTQEQLQEMIQGECYKLEIKHYNTSKDLIQSVIILSDSHGKPIIEFYESDYNSMWLKIIMKYKYNKFWNGEEWLNH